MPPLEKKRKKERKQEWSIDEWLEASIDQQKRALTRKAKTRVWKRNLKSSVEVIISSNDPVSGTALSVWAGVPTWTGTVYWAFA